MAKSYTELQEAITRSRAGQVRWRCPLPLREEIVQFTRECQRDGIAVGKVAQELGISESGLSRWLHATKSRLRPVRVADSPRVIDEALLVLVTPGGYRLEGLDSASAADLLRRLEC